MGKATLSAPLPAKQDRSRRTRDALLAAGWKLLGRTSWDQLSVNDIVAEAKSSVGSFYSRFADKESYFDSLALQWLERRRAHNQVLYERLRCTDDYVAAVVMDVYRSILGCRNFWHAAMIRAVRVPEFWVPFRESGLRRIREFTRLRTEELGRELTARETQDIRFAFQMVNGVINNGILNRPGPIMLETREFEVALLRGFRAVAGLQASPGPGG
ncbi:MAG TPA: TetR/AcrR family transcriptional regulator [Steroidobacteraceae bacterium]|nr:TetR/AcrR family transcriptional regulator [Steroidobacteraceae bacterium]